jgi:RHS repeat-associated protein
MLTVWFEIGMERSTNLNRTYDANRGWMTNLTVQTQGSNNYIVNQGYAYYPNGQLQTSTDSVSPALTATYSYDYLNRLSNATTSSWGLAWTYDDFGNRLTQSATAGSPPTSSLTYDTTNYTNRITASGYTYDNNGNLTAFPGPQGTTSVTYDAFDRAVSFTVGSSTSTVSYDAFGRRIQKTFSGGMQRLYFYSAQGQLLAEYDNPASGNGPSRTTQYFAGQRLGQWTDRVGSKRADSGSSSQYYPYGEEITSTNNDTYKFAQTYRDSDSGLDYANARFYVSGIGRFLTADPAGRLSARPDGPQSFNRYAYTEGNPVNFSDPGGMFVVANPNQFCWQTPYGGEAGGSYTSCFYPTTFGSYAPVNPGDDKGPLNRTNAQLLAASLARVTKNMTDKCAQALGAKDAAAANAKLTNNTLQGFSDLGQIQVITDSNLVPIAGDPDTPPMAKYDSGAIELNSSVNWSNPDATVAVNQNGDDVTDPLLQGTALQLAAVGGAGITIPQFMDLVILHELSHGFGNQHPADPSAFNQNIWTNCFP